MPGRTLGTSACGGRRVEVAEFPVGLDTEPMEAKSVDALPAGEGWQFEPKWDGFRCLAFKAGVEVDLRAKSGKSLSRYFPEMVEALQHARADNFVLDGESPSQCTREQIQQELRPGKLVEAIL